uniref:vesicular, overexpressed in cancer, prosurvival protein 1-like n=1 Tax=Oncorhynchus gorbuscha TaxID=8017 RepID=UPI001EAF88FC|nr:vesicular, overexpressed in cancer, prosurvival protein 1-like [Oncorhynchus gorbuscha]
MALLAAADDGCVVLLWGGVLHPQMHVPLPLPEDTFNVAFTRHPMTAPGLQQASMQNYGDPGGMILTPTFPYSPHPYPSHLAAPYPHPTPPAYCNLPPPPYEQVLQASEKR